MYFEARGGEGSWKNSLYREVFAPARAFGIIVSYLLCILLASDYTLSVFHLVQRALNRWRDQD